jgi:hypothetical protein
VADLAEQAGRGRGGAIMRRRARYTARNEDALVGLERWKVRHPDAAGELTPSTWTRIRVNLRHAPEAERPIEGPPDPDHDPWSNQSQDSARTGRTRPAKVPAMDPTVSSAPLRARDRC